jgi:hypothetical protein
VFLFPDLNHPQIYDNVLKRENRRKKSTLKLACSPILLAHTSFCMCCFCSLSLWGREFENKQTNVRVQRQCNISIPIYNVCKVAGKTSFAGPVFYVAKHFDSAINSKSTGFFCRSRTNRERGEKKVKNYFPLSGMASWTNISPNKSPTKRY